MIGKNETNINPAYFFYYMFEFLFRSSWTKTPQSADSLKTKPESSTSSKEALQSHALDLYEKQRDAEQEAMAKKHKKKHKRDQSLVEIHQKKLRKEEKRRVNIHIYQICIM